MLAPVTIPCYYEDRCGRWTAVTLQAEELVNRVVVQSVRKQEAVTALLWYEGTRRLVVYLMWGLFPVLPKSNETVSMRLCSNKLFTTLTTTQRA